MPPQAQKELLGWIDTGNEGAVDKFFADAMAKSLLLDWMMKLAMHNSGQRTPYASLKHYQQYETGSISSLLAQDVLLMAGAEDHYIPVHRRDSLESRAPGRRDLKRCADNSSLGRQLGGYRYHFRLPVRARHRGGPAGAAVPQMEA
jgi:hypothetical protein